MIQKILNRPFWLFRLVKRIADHEVLPLAAQTAFYLMLSLMPLLLFLVSILNQADIRLDYEDLRLFLPHDMANLVLEIGKMAPPRGGWTLVSLVGSAWSASAGVWALMRGIHRAYQRANIPNPVKNRLLTIVFTAGFAVSIVISLALGVFGNALSDFLEHGLGGSVSLTTPLRYIITLGFIFLFVTLLYTLTPGVKGRPRRHMPGALCAAAGWMALSWGYEFYMSRFGHTAVIYGGIGAAIGFMLWLLILCAIVLIGAEINAFRQEAREAKADTTDT